MAKKQTQTFRHRGFKTSADGPVEMIFGDGPEPTSKDGTKVKKLWDHDVEQVITVKDHVEPKAK